MSTEERRAPGATRIPFDALVEVGGALGPTFEAQAVNVSEEGIQLRTAYLPEPGQPLTCRFDGGPGHEVLAAGEVAWSQGADQGGEFGVRFTEIDTDGVDALKRICGVAAAPSPVLAGARVRLHIDGLASPMRAKIRDSHASAVTVGSDLGFLQVGRQLELEDAQSGAKRPASIDRVDVSVDPTSQIPQLVVTLRYSDAVDAPGSRVAAASAPPAPRGRAPEPVASSAPKAPRVRLPMQSAPSDDMAAVENASLAMKGALARGIDQIGPALSRLAEQAKTTVGVLIARRGERGDDASASRRTTAPAPGGGLHTEGRRVFRGEGSAASDREEAAPPPARSPLTGRRAAIAGGVMIAAILGAFALKKMHHETPVVAAPADSAAIAASAAASAAAAPAAVPVPSASVADNGSSAPSPSLASEGDVDSDGEKAHHKHLHVAPFASGPVHHGNILRLKMDAPIEAIEGAAQPTGFAVKIPGRKSLEAAAPLAARDARIAAIKVSNGTAGAELTVAFKDGVPTYRVSAKGDTLIIALAPPGALESASTPTMAKKDEKGGQSPTHARHSHDHANGASGASSTKSGDEAL